ncbi:hypothetical protein [Bradyrhizobium pachyrhizi]|uniref:hypothetical protein n=1 Tax=Bradyrhizobium pachyrhizi TaxID=280333 RepID=UPI000AC47F60|nr:hypothetical protein [Bradyrhizobium pachyrhizi]
MRRKLLALAILPALSLSACQEHGTEERLRAAGNIVAGEYNLWASWLDVKFENGTLVVAGTRGPPKRYELQEPEYCKFIFTVDAGTSDYTTTTADLSKLNRLEVVPTISGLLRIVYLAGSEANTVERHSRYGNEKSNKVRLNNLEPAKIDAFLSKVAEFQEKFCGVKVSITRQLRLPERGTWGA